MEAKENDIIKICVNLLESNHNLILTGAPGTGKTYLAKEIAKEMRCSDDEIGFVQFHPSYDYTDFVEGLRPIQDENGTVGFELKKGIFKEFCRRALTSCTIKQTDLFEYGYNILLKEIEDANKNGSVYNCSTYGSDNHQFKLTKTNDGIVFHRSVGSTTAKKEELRKLYQHYLSQHITYVGNVKRDDMEKILGRTVDYTNWRGIVQRIIELGQHNNKSSISNSKKHVFIIDEINRGEISKIFGELFFSIDPGYRGKKGKVRTQYANMQSVPNEFDEALGITDTNNYGHFYIPENVYIIGTMNDIDRSVESMDFAFRRRFAFKEIKADVNIGMLDNLDASVKEKATNRMKNLNNAISQIDGLSSAYHIGGSYFLKLKNYDNNFEDLWNYHIEGLLREYLRGNPEIEKHISKLKTAYQNDKKDVSPENNG